jgi:hypothetical protein
MLRRSSPNRQNNEMNSEASLSSSYTSPRKAESAETFTPPPGPGNPPKGWQRPISSKSVGSNDGNDSTSPLMDRIRKSFASCVYPDGQSVIDPKKSGPPQSQNGDEVGTEVVVTTSTSPSNGADVVEPEVRILTPNSLESVTDEVIKRIDDIEKEFINQPDLKFEIVGKSLTLSIPSTNEEQNIFEDVVEKREEIYLVQSNVTDTLGGRAWELVAEEKVFSCEKDDIMPQSASDNPSPKMIPCRLAKLGIEVERHKLGEKRIEKLWKAEAKRQKLLERKRINIIVKQGERQQVDRPNKALKLMVLGLLSDHEM